MQIIKPQQFLNAHPTMIFTSDKVAQKKLSVKEKLDFLHKMYEIINNFGIDEKNRQLFFLAQSSHETQGFTRYCENLNYSAGQLKITFRGKFSDAEYVSFAKKPAEIANRVYAGRNGNGDEQSGDGYLYRGRGFLMTTGKANYADLNDKSLSANYTKNPDLLMEFVGAVESACYFWKKNNLNESADAMRFDKNTRKINGGFNGLSDRNARLARLLELANR